MTGCGIGIGSGTGVGTGVTDCANRIVGNKLQSVSAVRKRAFRMVSSSIQLANGPIGVLAHGGIEILGLTKLFQMWLGLTVVPFDELIDQRHLH